MKYLKFPCLKNLLCLLCILPMLVLPADAAVPCNSPVTDSGVTHILLVGLDDHTGAGNSRSDSILLCSFHPERQTLTLTSILRDLYVPIPGHKNNRINAAFAFGGAELLEQTVEKTFRIPVDGTVTVDFSQFPRLIDLLGGVTLDIRADEAQAINQRTPGNLTEGKSLLNGDQALAYVRIRKLDDDGDFSRTNRQRKLILALLEAYRGASLPQILQVLEEAVSLVETNLSRKEIFKTVLNMTPRLSALRVCQQYVPQEGTYEYRTVRGMSVLMADLEAARAFLRDTLYKPET